MQEKGRAAVRFLVTAVGPLSASTMPTIHARKVLAPVYRRFTEGFKTADLLAAKALLDALR